MFRKKVLNDKQILFLVRIIDSSKKFLIVLALIGQFACLLPQRSIQARSISSLQEVQVDDHREIDFNQDAYADVNRSELDSETEIESMRSLNEKVFRKSDGSYELSIFPDVIHYNDNGTFLDIDNTLEERNNEIENKTNAFKIKFPKSLSSNKKVKFTQDDYKINWRLVNSQASNARTNNTSTNRLDESKMLANSSIKYEDVLPNVDIEYILSGNKVKENIYLNEFSSNVEFIFEYDVKNLTLVQDDNGLVFKNKAGEVVFSFSGLFMIDANQDISEAIAITSKQMSKNVYEITITPDEEWLKKASYPVIIDPTLYSIYNPLSLEDTYVYQASPTSVFYNASSMKIGGSINSEARGLMKFVLPEMLSDKIITYAHIELFKNDSVNQQNNYQINIFKNTSDFNPQKVSWRNGRPTYDSNNVIDYYNYITGNTPVIFDVTKTVKEWQAGESENYGFTLAADDLTGEIKQFKKVQDISSRPIIRIGYEDPSGLKDYWTYTSHDLGQMGTGYISDYTGNLTLVRNEFQVSNELLPLSLSFFFNNAKRTENIGYGNGWKTNYHMKMVLDNAEGGYYLLKPDGHKVYFSITSSYSFGPNYYKYYIAEDGSRMVFILNEVNNGDHTYRTITTSDQIEYHFDEIGRLFSIKNLRNSQLTSIEYVGDTDRIAKVIGMGDNRIVFSYTNFSTNTLLTKAELNLKQVNSNSFNTVQVRLYDYDNGSNNPTLKSVTQLYNLSGEISKTPIQGDKSTYVFDSISRLTSIYNETTNNRVFYSYDSIHRIENLEITDGNYNLSELNVEYTHGKTRYVNQRNEWIEYLFDSYGHTINALDSYGNATYRRYAGLYTYSIDNDNILADSQLIAYTPNYYIVHALLESSETMKQQINYINNHSFENNTIDLGWTRNGSGSIQKDTNESVMGESSLRIYSSGDVYAQQTVFLKAGVYKLQGVVKNTNISGIGNSGISVTTSSGTNQDLTSDVGEWKHLSVQFEVEEDQSVTITLTNSRYGTNTYFDNISLTEGFMDTRLNNLMNSSFEEGVSNWNLSGASLVLNESANADKDILGDKTIKIIGDGSSERYLYQDITNAISLGKTYIIGGWGKANSVPNKGYVNSNGKHISDGRFFGIYIMYEYYDSDYPSSDTPLLDYIYLPFNTDIDEWQYQMRTFKIDVHSLVSVRVYGLYKGEGTAYFDNIQLYDDNLSSKYSYDLDTGYLESVQNKDGSVTAYERDENGNITSIEEGNKTTSIEYNQNLITEISSNNVKTTFTYDPTSKQVIETLIGDNSTNGEWFKSNITYTTDGQYVLSNTDEFGHTTTYETNHLNGLIKTVTNANSHLKDFTYNDFGELIQQIETDISNQYTIVKNFEYDSKHRISKLSIDGVSYLFIYDSLDRILQIRVNGVNYVSFDYVSEQQNGSSYVTNKVDKQTYSTGDSYTFSYNDENQIKSVKFNDLDRYEYVYDQSGRLAIYKEIENNQIYFYSYDLAGRLKQVVDKQGNKIIYTYDDQGNINKTSYEVHDLSRDVYFYYDESTNEYLYTFYDTGNETVKKINHIDTTDSLRRLSYVELLIGTLSFTEHISYKTPSVNRGNASLVIASIEYKMNGSTQFSHHYTYDALGNITSIIVNNRLNLMLESYDYYYDGFNRLVREDIWTEDFSLTRVYIYDEYYDSKTNDNRGNITSIKHYYYQSTTGTPISETRLFYSTNGWRDQISSIEHYESGILKQTDDYQYDSIGNLISIDSDLDSDQLFDFEGRNLIEHKIGNQTYSYTYNNQGIRTSKSDGLSMTEYILEGNLVLVEKKGNDVIYYTYDRDGSILSFNYQGNEYFYIKNLQGDIIKIIDATGNTVATYRYDAWGNIIDSWDSNIGIGSLNPYRYRSYRYDTETGLYYLNARYYDPSIGRFISADSISYLDPSSEQGLNLYAYCNNNPVMYSDPSGNMPEWLKWTIGGAVIVGTLIAVIATGGAVIAVGAFVGSLVGGGVGLISGVSFDENGFHFDSNKASTGFMFGSITGAISGAIGAKIGAIAKLGTYGQRAIMAGIDGTLSLGAYLGQAGIHGDRISLGGALVSFGSGLFSFADPTGYKVVDAIWGPMMGAEIAWAYDLISGMDRKPNVATRRLIPYF